MIQKLFVVISFVFLCSAGISPAYASYLPVSSTGNVGIGTATPNAKLEVQKTGAFAPFMVSSTGTTDGDYLVVLSAGNIGVGTTTARNKFDVNGTAAGSAGIYLNSAVPSSTTNTLYNNGGALYFNGSALGAGAVNSGTSGYFSYYPSTGTTVDDQTILYTDGTNVGIGSTSPAYKLDVTGTAHITGAVTLDTDLTVANGGTGASTLTGLVLGNGTSAFTAVTTSAGISGAISDETGSGALVFGTSPTFTTSIIDPLVIGGTAVGSSLTLRSTSGVGTTGADIIFQTGNNGATEAMRVLNNGNVGIGSASPAATFEVKKTSTNPPLAVTNSALGDYVLITSSGNLGISSVNPQTRLDVNGDIWTAEAGTARSSNYDMGANHIGAAGSIYSYGGICSGNGHAYCSSTGGVTISSTSLGTPNVGIFGTGASYFNGGNVGINTTVPQALLEVDGALYLGRMTAPSPTTDRLYNVAGTLTWNGTALTGGGGSGTVNSGTSGYFTYYPSTGTTVDDQTVLYTNGTNVGIGTTGTTSKLTVSSNTGALPATAAGTVAHFGSTDSSNTRVLLDSFNAVNHLSLRRANSTAASPTALLSGDVLGHISWFGYGSSAYSSNARVQVGGVAAENWTDSAQGTSLIFVTTSTGGTTLTERMRIDGSGNLGIATSTPNATLEVQKSGTTPPLMVSSAGSTDGDYLSVASGGNVGIGSTSPAYKLDVTGTAHITGAVTLDTDLTVANGGTGASTLTGILIGNGTSAFTAATTSAGISGELSDETGSGALVFGTSPTFTTSIIDPLVIGGTAVGSSLTLRSTSGVGTTGADIIFQTGNNGATEAMRVLNNGNVGIGSAAPSALIDVVNSTLTTWTQRIYQSHATAGYGLLVHAGNDTSNKIAEFRDVGGNAHMTILGVGYVGINTTAPMANLEVKRNPTTTAPLMVSSAAGGNGDFLVVTSSGNVGIGNIGPGYKLTINGTAWVTSGAWTGSDIRWKKNVEPVIGVLDKVKQLRAVKFDWRDTEFPSMGFSTDRQVGFIAQDVEPVFPELVTTAPDGYKGVSYEKLSPILAQAVKEMDGEIMSLNALIQEQSKVIERQKEALQSYETELRKQRELIDAQEAKLAKQLSDFESRNQDIRTRLEAIEDRFKGYVINQ